MPFHDRITQISHALQGRTLGLILLLGLALRLNGITFGLPYPYNPDELDLINPVRHILATGDLNPRWFGLPGSFVIYLLCLVLLLVLPAYYLFQAVLQGGFLTLSEFKDGLVYDPSVLFVTGRCLMSLLAVLSIYLIYLLCKRRLNTAIALLSAFVLAIAPLHIDHSRLIRPDITATILILFALLWLDFYIETGKRKYLDWAALCAGFAVATKYPSGLVLLPILTYALFEDLKRPRQETAFLFHSLALRAAIFSFLGFFLTAPFVLLDFTTTLKNIAFEARSFHLGRERLPGIQNFIWYLRFPLGTWAGGLIVQVFSAWGLVKLVAARNGKDYVLFLIFPALTFWLIANAALRWSRWALPIFPFEAAFFGIGFYSFYQLSRKISLRPLRITLQSMIILTLIICSAVTIQKAINKGNRLRQTDIRTLAKQWVEENLPPQAVIAYETLAPPLHVRPAHRFRLINMGWAGIVSRPLEYYRERGVDYVIIADNFKKRYYAEPEKYAVEIARYAALHQQAKQIKRIAGNKNPGPALEIYQLRA